MLLRIKYGEPFILLLTWCTKNLITLSQIVFLELCPKNNKQSKYIKKSYGFLKYSYNFHYVFIWLGKNVIAYSESYDIYIYQKKIQSDPIKKKAKIDFFNKANISIFLYLLDRSLWINHISSLNAIHMMDCYCFDVFTSKTLHRAFLNHLCIILMFLK